MVELFKDNAIQLAIPVFLAAVYLTIMASLKMKKSSEEKSRTFFLYSAVLTGFVTFMILVCASWEIFFSASLAGYIDWRWLMMLYITWLVLSFPGVVLYKLGKRRA